jgi:hypothetical protein
VLHHPYKGNETNSSPELLIHRHDRYVAPDRISLVTDRGTKLQAGFQNEVDSFGFQLSEIWAASSLTITRNQCATTVAVNASSF